MRRQVEGIRRGTVAYQRTKGGNRERTDVERAECLLSGLQSDVEIFYEQVASRAGLGSRSYEEPLNYSGLKAGGSIVSRLALLPKADSSRGAADEFISKSGINPRSFLNRGMLKGMAYRLRKLGGYIEMLMPPDGSSLRSGYMDLMEDLQRTGIYRELVKSDRRLGDLPATSA